MMPFLVGHPNIVKQVFSRAWELVWDEIIFIRTCEIHLAFNHGMEIVSMCRYSLTKLEEIMGDKNGWNLWQFMPTPSLGGTA